MNVDREVPARVSESAVTALNAAVPALWVMFVANVAAPVCVRVPELDTDVAVTVLKDDVPALCVILVANVAAPPWVNTP